jgi:hypothetical protein
MVIHDNSGMQVVSPLVEVPHGLENQGPLSGGKRGLAPGESPGHEVGGAPQLPMRQSPPERPHGHAAECLRGQPQSANPFQTSAHLIGQARTPAPQTLSTDLAHKPAPQALSSNPVPEVLSRESVPNAKAQSWAGGNRCLWALDSEINRLVENASFPHFPALPTPLPCNPFAPSPEVAWRCPWCSSAGARRLPL